MMLYSVMQGLVLTKTNVMNGANEEINAVAAKAQWTEHSATATARLLGRCARFCMTSLQSGTARQMQLCTFTQQHAKQLLTRSPVIKGEAVSCIYA